MKINNITLKNNLILAPMAGFSVLPLRRLMAENGAGLTITEMISAKALLYNNQKTAQMLKTHESEKVKCVQLFGSDPTDFFKCATLPILNDFDIIDVNMGCSVKKIVKNGEGSALMAQPKKAAEIIRAIKSAGRIATAKTRLGIAAKDEIFDFALRLEDAGLDLLAVHARTARQLFSGEPDFSFANKLKERLRIPLVINGNIANDFNFKYNVDGFMIGRGALINPAIFLNLCGKDGSKKQLTLSLIDYMKEYYGAEQAAVEIRKFLPYSLKGINGGKEIRINAITSNNISELKSALCSLAFF